MTDVPPSSPGEAAARARPRRRWRYRVLIVVGGLLIAATVAWQVNAAVWSSHSTRAGKALVNRFLNEHSLSTPAPATTVPVPPGSATLVSCAQSTSADQVKGLLEIPKIGVTGPVEDGTDDAQLNVAIGHVPGSVWPGDTGNSVLEAHDVSYFVNLAQLQAGDTIRYIAPCITYTFTVQSHSVVHEGSPVYNTSTPTLTLVTCWPTNALWFTPERYLVTATLASSSLTGAAGRSYLASQPPPAVPVPQPLAAQGVTLETYSVPMGAMALTGSPDSSWAQSTNPLLVESSAVKAFIAGVRSLTENRLDWWGAIAPGVQPPQPLVGAQNPRDASPLNGTITAEGIQATSVALSTTVNVSGGSAPGHYTINVGETISNGTLVVSSWTLS